MHLPISEQYFDPLKGDNRSLVENFMFDCGVSLDTLQFATDYYWVSEWIEAILDYYDLEDDFEEYMKDNRDEYVLDDNDEDEDEDSWDD